MKSIIAMRSLLCLFLVLSIAPAITVTSAATPQLSVSPTLYLPMLSAGNTSLPMPVVFVSNSDNDHGVYLAQPSVSSYQLLTAESASAPALSPDRSKLAFSSGRAGNQEIYLLDMASKQLQRLTNNTFDDNRPKWSPDGRWIAFDSTQYGSYDILIMAADGTQTMRLTAPPANDTWADW